MESNRAHITTFGFWLYLMTDCILFATLFATHAVLQPAQHVVVSSLFSYPCVLAETLVLLTSTLSCALAGLSAEANRKKQVLIYLAITFILGASFLSLEFKEFHHLIASNHSWEKSAFLSSFFTLVGTHGVHISMGMLWMFVLACQILRSNLTPTVMRRLTCFRMFWHFLDIVWIFIFTFVYLMSLTHG